MKISVLLLTIDRYHLTKEYVGKALAQAGIPFELCITDNGSTQPEIFQWCEAQNPTVYNKNGENKGTAQSLNRMIEQNPSDYYVFIGNDIQLPDQWLKTLVDYAESIPESGIVGIDWRGCLKQCEQRFINGKEIRVNSNIFGTMFFSQKVREKIGKMCEDYGPYGLWDSDYALRAGYAGFTNYYLPHLTSHHFGSDVGEKTPYRKMKDESLSKAKPIFTENWEKYKKGDFYL